MKGFADASKSKRIAQAYMKSCNNMFGGKFLLRKLLKHYLFKSPWNFLDFQMMQNKNIANV